MYYEKDLTQLNKEIKYKIVKKLVTLKLICSVRFIDRLIIKYKKIDKE